MSVRTAVLGRRPGLCAWAWLSGVPMGLVIAVFGDGYLRSLWGTTLLLGGLASAIAVPLGAILAWLLWRLPVRGRTVAIALVAAWLVMPLYLQAAAWKALADIALGTTIVGSWQTGSALLQAGWVHGAHAVPWSTAAFSVAIFFLPRAWEEQALLESRPVQAWLAATWPVWLGASAVSVAWIMVVATTDITVTDLFQLRTFAEAIYLQYALGDATPFRPLSWESLLILAWLAFVVATTVRRMHPPIGEAVERTHWQLEYRSQHGWAATAALWSVLAFWVALPTAMLAYQAGVAHTSIDGQWTARWSGWKLLEMLVPLGSRAQLSVVTQFATEWYWSAWITGLGSLVTVCLASLLAWAAAAKRRLAIGVLTVLVGVAVVPGPQWGIWLVQFFTAIDVTWLNYLYDRTITAPVVAGVLRALPLTTLVWWLGFRTLPRHLCEAASLGGWGFWKQWWLLALPARRRIVFPALGLAGAIIFGDLAATLPVIPPGVLTITVRVFDLLHAGVDDMAAAICLALGIVVTLGTASVLAATRGLRR